MWWLILFCRVNVFFIGKLLLCYGVYLLVVSYKKPLKDYVWVFADSAGIFSPEQCASWIAGPKDIHFLIPSSSPLLWTFPAPLRTESPRKVPSSALRMVARAPCVRSLAVWRRPNGSRNGGNARRSTGRGSTTHWRFCPMKLESCRKIPDTTRPTMWCPCQEHHILLWPYFLQVAIIVSRSTACCEAGGVRLPASFRLTRSLLKHGLHTLPKTSRCHFWRNRRRWDRRAMTCRPWLTHSNLPVRTLLWRWRHVVTFVTWISGVPLRLLVILPASELMPLSGAPVLPPNPACGASCMMEPSSRWGSFQIRPWWGAPWRHRKRQIFCWTRCGGSVAQRPQMIRTQDWWTATLFPVLSFHAEFGTLPDRAWRLQLRWKSKKTASQIGWDQLGWYFTLILLCLCGCMGFSGTQY